MQRPRQTPRPFYFSIPTQFEQQPNSHFRGLPIEIAQWANPSAVKPLAKLAVTPADFPFLERTRSYDFNVIRERVRVDPQGFPWLADDEV